MYLPDFDYYIPDNLQEACTLLAEKGPGAKVLAGGTDLLNKMKHGLVAPDVLISLKKINQLTSIDYLPGKGVVIGARATHNMISNSDLLQKNTCLYVKPPNIWPTIRLGMWAPLVEILLTLFRRPICHQY